MTVQQLFKQEGFEAMMSALQNTHRNDKSIKATAMYKQAFDKLLMTEPSGRGGEVTFDVTPRDKWFTRGHLPMLANGVEGDLWEDIVGKEVVRPADNPFTDAELAGAILWGATFYGFTTHSSWSPTQLSYGKFGEQAKELKRRLYVPYIRDKEVLRKLKTDPLRYGIAFSSEIWIEIFKRRKHQNRHKRKRVYRMKNRIRELKNLDKRANTIAVIEAKTRKSLGSLADKIIYAGSICEDWRECHVVNTTDRVDYLINLCSNYFPQASEIMTQGKETVIVAYTSPENTLSANESARLQEYFKTLAAPSAFLLLEGSDPDISSALDVEFISICDTVISNDDDD